MKISGAELIIQWLEKRGIDLVAGVPGGAVLPLYAALGASKTLRHILVRHEQAAGFIAQGMARTSGRAGVCFVTSGPGVTNVLTALADAKLDSVPLVCIAGQVPTGLIGTDAFQEVATCELARPITKASYFVKSADQIATVLDAAFTVAEQGRPGPVLIDLPKDVQTQQVSVPPVLPAHHSPGPSPAVGHGSALYDRAAALIATARRPVLYLGGGVVQAQAQALARKFAHRTQIPVATTLMALGLLEQDHPLHLGMLGMHGARSTNLVIDSADLLIAIGARFDDRATGDAATFAARARIIHIDIDPRELGKIRTPTLAIQDDAASALRELIGRLPLGASSAANARRAWHCRIAKLKLAHPLHRPRRADLCSPYGIMEALGQVLPADAIVTTDVGQHQMWAAQALPLRHGQRWLTSGGLGTMGFGLPTAMGAALADAARPVVCITGDGSLLMNIQELSTLAELDLNVKIIVLDNAGLGMVRQQQTLFYGGRHVGSGYRRTEDFIAVARAFGIGARDLGVEREPLRVLQQVMAAPGPLLVRVPIDEKEQVLPMVAPGAANVEALDHAAV